MVYKKPRHLIDESTNKIKKLILERGHIFISGEYSNRTAPLVVYCPFHNKKVETTFYNYERSITGLQCCGREQVSEKLLSIYRGNNSKDACSCTKETISGW